ncbi:unnamed protein product [Paramecium sonneborni]|uniref:Uncharacterized protein n=1 Tax=Paramecium sonneborni TaxID=65129 RepID=A0A8S1NJN1_9CILI|nr:unnamed protein product [Paramecium sonneborni]
MFNINQAQIKNNLLINKFEVIEFTIDTIANYNDQLIQFENGILQLKIYLIQQPNKTLSIEDSFREQIISFLIRQFITQFLNQHVMVVLPSLNFVLYHNCSGFKSQTPTINYQFTKQNLNDLQIEKEKSEISVDQNYKQENEQELLTLILKIIFKITKQTPKSNLFYGQTIL